VVFKKGIAEISGFIRDYYDTKLRIQTKSLVSTVKQFINSTSSGASDDEGK
jgi:hypothetical protein